MQLGSNEGADLQGRHLPLGCISGHHPISPTQPSQRAQLAKRISACHAHPQPCPSLTLLPPTLEECISKTLALPSLVSLLIRDASRTHAQGLAMRVLGWLVFMPLTIALCFPIHIRGAVFPLALGVQALGEGQWGKIAEKAD